MGVVPRGGAVAGGGASVRANENVLRGSSRTVLRRVRQVVVRRTGSSTHDVSR